MDELQLFNFKGNQVRTLEIDDEPYFVGKDVAKILGYSNPSVAISKNIANKFKGVTEMETPGGTQKVVLHTKWTQKGRLGLYNLLKKHGILPLIEREENN